MCLLAFRRTIVVLMTVNAQNHYFTLYQLGPFQLQVIENPAPKYFIQKKEVLIHVSEKSWLQAQLDPGVQIRSNKVGFLTTLNTMLAQDSCGGKIAPATLNPLSDLLHAQGERELPSRELCQQPQQKKKTFYFHHLRFCREYSLGPTTVAKRNVTPAWLKSQSLNLA